MANRICTRCGAAQTGQLRHCQRCSLALQPGYGSAAVPRPQPLVPAASRPGQAPVALRPGQGGRAQALLPALDASPPRPAHAGLAARAAPPGLAGLQRRPTALRNLAWVTGGLVGCGALLLGAQLALPEGAGMAALAALAGNTAGNMADNTADSAPGGTSAQAATPEAEAALPVGQVAGPQPVPTPAADSATLEQAINAALRSHGFGGVHVQLSDSGVATVSGEVPAGTDPGELLRWLGALPGVDGVEDALSPAAPPPAPRLARRTARPVPAAQEEDADAGDDADTAPSPPAPRGNSRSFRTETTTVHIYRQTR